MPVGLLGGAETSHPQSTWHRARPFCHCQHYLPVTADVSTLTFPSGAVGTPPCPREEGRG